MGKRSSRVTDVFFGSGRPPSAGLRPLLHRRLDILIEAEEVGRIIFILQRYQPRILRRPIGRLHPLGALVRLLSQGWVTYRGSPLSVEGDSCSPGPNT